MKTIAAVLAILLSTFIVPSTSAAQLFGGGERVNVEFIPGTAFAGAAIFPQQIAEDPKFELVPREIITAWGLKELGFDPLMIKQATFIVKQMDSLNRPPQWAAILHFEKMQGLAGNLIDRLDAKKVGGKAMFSGTSVGMPSFLIYDEATIFVGDEAFFQDMVTADKSGALVDLIKNARVKGEMVAFADIKSVRPVLNQAMGGLPGFLPPAIAKLKAIPDQIEAMEYGLKAEGGLNSTLIVHMSNTETAKETSEVITNALEFGSEMGLGFLAAQMDFNDPVQEAVVDYAQRVAAEYRQKLTPEVTGNRMTIQMDEEITALPIAVAFLLPAAQSARAAARRTQSMNNKKQMVLAMHNYQLTTGKLPAQASYDKNGKPLLSWRVHILPYIEQQELYDQFHLDEPWDSPHNKKLITKIPPIYLSPSVPYYNDGKTVYLGVAGEGFAFNKTGRTFQEYRDGSSNTVLTVEANPEQAVEWTKPADWSFDPKRPLEGLGKAQPGGFIVSMADGSVQVVSPDIDPESWKALLTINGGEAVPNGF